MHEASDAREREALYLTVFCKTGKTCNPSPLPRIQTHIHTYIHTHTHRIEWTILTDSYPVAFRRRKIGDAEDSGKEMKDTAKGYGKDELSVFPTILWVPLKATGYESAIFTSRARVPLKAVFHIKSLSLARAPIFALASVVTMKGVALFLLSASHRPQSSLVGAAPRR